MNTESTSLEPVNSAPAQWQHFARFIQRPALPDQTTDSQGSFGARFAAQFGSGLKAVLRMLALDLTIMVALLSLVLVYVLTIGDLPSNALNDLELTPGVILAIVIGAPLGEELAFRSWLSGRPRYLIFIPIALIAAGVAAAIGVASTSQGAAHGITIAMGCGMIVGIFASLIVWKRPPMRWFRAIFPFAFWFSALAFALIHIANYQEGDWYALLPLVLPQLVLGTICAYLRVHHGLWSAILMHALHNGIIVLLVMFGLQVAQ